jgi:serine/threonine protein kinase
MIARKRRQASSDGPTVIMCPGCGQDITSGDRFCVACGTPVPFALEADLLYDIVGSLGRGGMGIVFLAHDMALNRKVAIKVLLPSLVQGSAPVERFRREAQIAASLRHRHITSIFGFRETPRLLYFVMEYVAGQTLDSVIEDRGALPIDLAVALLLDVADALDYAHRNGVVHRDIKPSNIIVDTDGMAVVTDFGIAKVSGTTGVTSTGSAVGSPRYMSPEQWGGKASALSDQYALGIVAYEMIAGRAPFVGDTLEELMKQQVLDPPPDVSGFRPDCPHRLAETIMRMLEKDPNLRWSTLDTAITHLGRQQVPAKHPVRRGLAESATRATRRRSLPSTPRSPVPIGTRARERTPAEKGSWRRPLRWLVAVVVVAVLGVGGYRALHLLREQGTLPGLGERSQPPVGTTSGSDVQPPPTAERQQPASPESALASDALAQTPGAEQDSTPPAEPPSGVTKAPPPPPLPPRPAVLQLIVRPWAFVTIDGVSRGRVALPRIDTLSAGRHRIRFERSGFSPLDTTIVLRAGESRRLSIQLSPRTP